MRSWSVIALVLLVAASLSVGVTPASAHSALVSSDPAADATVTAPLDRVTLTFSEAPLAGLGAGLRIEVRDDSGRDVSTGAVEISGTSMVKAVALADGPYRVLWRYVSPDGHPITGEYGFTASGASPTSTAASSASPAPSTADPSTPAPSEPTTSGPTATATAAPASATTHAGHSPVAVWVIGVVAVLAAATAAAAAVVRRRSARPTDRDDDSPVAGSAD
ncbi:MAG: copper resistance CopC family protein [Curtobacterium sp.]